MKTSGCADSIRCSHVVPAFCTPIPTKSTHGTRAAPPGSPARVMDCTLAMSGGGLGCSGRRRAQHVAERHDLDSLLVDEPVEELLERSEPARSRLDPRVKADREMRAAAASAAHELLEALEHPRGGEPFGFVLPVVGRDREARPRFAVLQAATIGIGLSAALCVPREARVGERAEYALVPRGLRAAMPEDRDAELLERAPRPLEILEELCLAEPREVRVIVRVARDLVARV